MKKIFTLIAVILVATISLAETETELELTEGHTLLLSTIENAGGVDTDIIRFYIVNTSSESREGWGIGGFANSDNWDPTVSWSGKTGTNWTYDYTVAEIKSTAGDIPGEWHGLGITVNIYNDCKVSKVTLVQAGDPVQTTTTTLWEGECSFGNWVEGLSISAEKFADVKEGEMIEYVYTTTENKEKNWYQFKTIFSGTEEVLTSIPDLNEWGCLSVSLGSTNFKYKLNADDSAKLKETGMYINGKDIIVTKVNLIQKGGTTSINLVNAVKSHHTIRYNLSGQRVDENFKGVVIMNGMKIAVK